MGVPLHRSGYPEAQGRYGRGSRRLTRCALRRFHAKLCRVNREEGVKNGRSLTDAISELVSFWGQAWNTPLAEPMGRGTRFAYALSGSTPWVWINVASSDALPGTLLVFGVSAWMVLPVALIVAAWFALLISFQPRRSSPARFFLEGLLFPSVAAFLVRGPLSHFYGG